MKNLVNYLKSESSKWKGVNIYYRESWECEYFEISGKCFGRIGEAKEGGLTLTVKGEPNKNIELREIYKSIIPGYYSNKVHWNTVLLEENEFEKEELLEILKESYDLVFSKLTKKEKEKYI